jgi:hypothetical protein
MVPHEKAMVEKLEKKPFALIGINSDGDRDVSKQLDEKEKTAIKDLGKPESEVIEAIRRGDARILDKLHASAPALEGKIRDADRATLRKILDKNKITWRQAVEGSTGGALATRWNISGWPTIYVLDGKGVIRFRDLRDQELEDAVVKLLAETDEGGKH